jgi:hypothetical protein
MFCGQRRIFGEAEDQIATRSSQLEAISFIILTIWPTALKETSCDWLA